MENCNNHDCHWLCQGREDCKAKANICPSCETPASAKDYECIRCGYEFAMSN